MPSRRSDRGKALARGIRENPELGQTLAEFSEPYGTMSAMQDIAQEPTDPMNYLYAMPVIGDAAKFAGKGKKAMDLARKNKKMPEPDFDAPQGPQTARVVKEMELRDLLEQLDSMDPEEARAIVLKLRETDPDLFYELTKQDLGYTPRRKLEMGVDNEAFDNMMGSPELPQTQQLPSPEMSITDKYDDLQGTIREGTDARSKAQREMARKLRESK